jgi:hypothetical protein
MTTRFVFLDEILGDKFVDVIEAGGWEEDLNDGAVKLLGPEERAAALRGGESLEKSAVDEWSEQLTVDALDEAVLMSRVIKRFAPVFKTKLLALGVDRESATEAEAGLSNLT